MHGCGERADEDVSTVTIPVKKVDGTAPVVACSINTTGLTGNGAGTFEDVGFSYNVSDNCSTLTSEVYSNEVESSGEDMVLVSSPNSDGESPSIYVHDSNITC
jgi:hypothetical protein